MVLWHKLLDVYIRGFWECLDFLEITTLDFDLLLGSSFEKQDYKVSNIDL